MRRVRAETYARAGLLGNPSDGYQGKTISVIVGNFSAEVVFEEAPELDFIPLPEDQRRYASPLEFYQAMRSGGYYGAERLVKAALKRFIEFIGPEQLEHQPNFRVSLSSNIPRQVGLAGSSAIVMATLRAAMQWFSVSIPPPLLASLTLAVEREELKIPAGLQDRVIQALEGMVYMDFSGAAMHQERGLAVGRYESLEVAIPQGLYVAYSTHGGEPTEVTHQSLRERFDAGEERVVQGMKAFAALAEEGKVALEQQDWERLDRLINANFDLRHSLCPLHPHHVDMVTRARAIGASAKFCGSGGAIVGTLRDPERWDHLESELGAIGCRVIRPRIGHFQPTDMDRPVAG